MLQGLSPIEPDDRRLLIVTESLGVGGTESHLIRTLPRLAELGWRVATFCLTERGERAEQVEAANVEVYSSLRIAKRKGSFLRYPAHVTAATNKLYWLMKRWQPRIAHFYLPAPYLVGAHVAIAVGTPIKVMSRRSLSNYQRNWPTVARLERRLHQRMDAVIGNSRAVVRELLDEGIPKSKVSLIYNGVGFAKKPPGRQEARKALGLDDTILIGVVVANLIHYKGHRELVRALSHVAANLSVPWRVLIAGRDHGIRAELEGLADARGIREHIHFLGENADISRLLAASDFGLLTSREEGFSNVILEGMAAGLPMIVTDVGGNAEAVIDGETGCVVPPYHPKGIADAILRLARNPELRRQLGEQARARAEDKFSIERCVRAHADLYEELLGRARRARMGTSATE